MVRLVLLRLALALVGIVRLYLRLERPFLALQCCWQYSLCVGRSGLLGREEFGEAIATNIRVYIRTPLASLLPFRGIREEQAVSAMPLLPNLMPILLAEWQILWIICKFINLFMLNAIA